ncbi:DUF4982 domain-containing protein, partial [Kitasatospora herbaricolor]|uniref:DUF4982 domain-containing protein n=1 Tax=Kitasatospora herbaricolor TaxID=68217 RepID=UPI0036D7D68E
HNWALVEKLPALIGDFMWAGWDYLGEAGGGSWAYGTRHAPYLKPYPQLTSGTGALDITGQPGAPALLAQTVWGLLDSPAIAVRPLDVTPGPVAKTSWRSTDAIPSWSWRGHEGRTAEIEVYSAAEQIELRLNGRSLGRKAAGADHGFVARFKAPYKAGTLQAIALNGNAVVGRSELRSSGPVSLRLRTETESLTPDSQALAYLSLELADDTGILDSTATDVITLEVEGPAELAGFGSGATSTTETFTHHAHGTYRGRALAAIRSTGQPGTVRVTARSGTYGTAVINITAEVGVSV